MSDASSLANLDPTRVDPERLNLILQESGWRVIGQRKNLYVRLSPPGEDRQSVLVPLDRQAPEYFEKMHAALLLISHFVIRNMLDANISARLVADPADTFLFRAESAAPSGLIAWTHGERLIRSSRRVLVAGAKTHLERLKYFGNRFGQFANRYLDTVLMGQTAPGSYIVTAFTPANGFVQISNTRDDESQPMFRLPSEAASTRSIGVSVMKGAAASKEAIEHYRSHASLSGFDDLVSEGISYEMTTALTDLLSGSDGADISVEWDPALDAPFRVPDNSIEFRPSDAEILTRASAQLAATARPPARMTIMGRVHLLSQREAGGPGIIGIDNLSPGKPRKLRAHLSDDDYHMTLKAHDRNDAVVVQGQVEREGNIHWMYDARLITVLGEIDGIEAQIKEGSTENIPGQLEFGE